MQHLTLPSGATADLREPADITERQRRPIKRIQAQLAARPAFMAAVKEAQAAEGADGNLTPDQQMGIAAGMGDAFDLLEDLNDALVAAAVAGWSYVFPVSADSAQDLPAHDLDALRTAVSPYVQTLMPDFEPNPSQESPTPPSAA